MSWNTKITKYLGISTQKPDHSIQARIVDPLIENGIWKEKKEPARSLHGNHRENVKHRDVADIWHREVGMVPLSVDAFGTVPKTLESSLDKLEFKGRS